MTSWPALAGVALAAAVVAAPLSARGAWTLAGSFGQGVEVSPRSGVAQTTSLLVAPGYGLGEALRAELGLVTAVDSLNHGQLDLELRPMLVIAPSQFPAYGRLIVAGVNLARGPRSVAVGAALGIDSGLWSGLHLFLEGGALPRQGKGPGGKKQMEWIGEARAGLVYPL
jgi:hypothetical protein